MKVEIKHRWTGDVLFSAEAGLLKLAVEAAVKSKADLSGAYLRGAYLRGADLSGAYLGGADLRCVDLRGAKNIWESHDLIAEILFRAAGADIDKRKLAGLVLISRDWCWKDFMEHDDPLKEWAVDTLRPWAEGDASAPEVFGQLNEKGGGE